LKFRAYIRRGAGVGSIFEYLMPDDEFLVQKGFAEKSPLKADRRIKV